MEWRASCLSSASMRRGPACAGSIADYGLAGGVEVGIDGLVCCFDAPASDGIHDQLVFAEHVPCAISSLADCPHADPELALPQRSTMSARMEFPPDRTMRCGT